MEVNSLAPPLTSTPRALRPRALTAMAVWTGAVGCLAVVVGASAWMVSPWASVVALLLGASLLALAIIVWLGVGLTAALVGYALLGVASLGLLASTGQPGALGGVLMGFLGVLALTRRAATTYFSR